MNSQRFRVTFEYDPTSLWRDIVVGADRTIVEFQSVLNRAVGLDRDHLWFFGTDQDFWHSDVKYKRPGNIERSTRGLIRGGEEYDAGETTIGRLAQRLDLDEGDRICYLYDDGDECPFYGVLEDMSEDGPSDAEPEVLKTKGDPVKQSAPPGERLKPGDFGRSPYVISGKPVTSRWSEHNGSYVPHSEFQGYPVYCSHQPLPLI